VDWWEWGPEAFAEAKRRDAPILLSVGYAACHWCHEVKASTAVGDLTKLQIRRSVPVHAGSTEIAVGHRFRGSVYHFRASLGPHHWLASCSHLSSPTQQFRALLRYKIGRVALQMYDTLAGGAE
jgi:hypothetical protein